MTNKYGLCIATKLIITPAKMYIMKCEKDKHHEGVHKQAEKEWNDTDHRPGSR